MVKKIWRAIRSMPPPGTRADYYCVCDSAEEAERRVREKYSFFEGETLAVELFEQFEWPFRGCVHPRSRLIFWQFGAETANRPRKAVRCYYCIGCGATVHDDTPDGHIVPCAHIEHKPKPTEDRVW
jgi:hypothetical protein